MLFAEDLISPGGPSAPVWAFLSVLVTAAFTTLGVLLKAKSDAHYARIEAKKAGDEAQKANESATQAQTNTANLSNGFASSVLGKLDRIHQSQQETEKALREHLQWHLNREE